MGRKTRTEKLLKHKRNEDKINSQHIGDLITHLRCGQGSCPKENAWCYIVDGINLKIASVHIKPWSMTIDEGEAGLETCPTALAKTLMPSRKGGKNSLREQASKAAGISIDSNHPLPQHLHLVNFLRFFHRIPTTLI